MTDNPVLFEDFTFTPADGLKNHEYSPTEPESEDAIRAQIQGISDQLRDHINDLQEQLNAVTEGSSGAHHIGSAAITGVSGESVAQQLASLKTLIDETAVGAIPDNSIASAKLQNGAITTEKLADNVVTEGKLASGSVTETKLADGAVTSGKLASGLGDFHEKHLITTSGNWSPPHDGIYTVTLLGGGGGGGSGFAVYDAALNENANFPRTFFCGAGGNASIAVSKRFALYEDETYTFVIGAGGSGRTGNAYVMQTKGDGYSTMPTFSSCDGFATEGGETSMALGESVLLETSQRVNGCAFGCYVPMMLSSYQATLLGGGSGAGYLPGTRNTRTISDNEISALGENLVINGGTGLMGGGDGGIFSRNLHMSGTACPGGNAKGYGCGGGGGCAPYVNRTTVPSFVNKGGEGGNGYALIEWFAPLSLPQT